MAEAQHVQVVPVPMDKILEAILDFEAYPRFAGGVKKCTLLKQEANQVVVQMEIELMKRIEYSIEVHKEVSDSKARVWWHLKDGDFFQKNDGLWELIKINDNSTQVLYRLDLDFSVSVPSFIIKGLIKTSLPKAVEDFTNEGKRRMK